MTRTKQYIHKINLLNILTEKIIISNIIIVMDVYQNIDL
jgi:hypothetical protein